MKNPGDGLLLETAGRSDDEGDADIMDPLR
jgi:hypothetical protein